MWEFEGIVNFLATFGRHLGLHPMTVEDLEEAFLECNIVLKAIVVRLVLPPRQRSMAPQICHSDDEWLRLFREKFREWNKKAQQTEQPLWKNYFSQDPWPDSCEQYYQLSLKQRVILLWALCESILGVDEESRRLTFPRMNWADADALREMWCVKDAQQSRYLYVQGTGVVFREESPRVVGSKSRRPSMVCVSEDDVSLRRVGKKLQTEGRESAIPLLSQFGRVLHDEEAPFLASKEHRAQRLRTQQAFEAMQMNYPRTRSSRSSSMELAALESGEKRLRTSSKDVGKGEFRPNGGTRRLRTKSDDLDLATMSDLEDDDLENDDDASFLKDGSTDEEEIDLSSEEQSEPQSSEASPRMRSVKGRAAPRYKHQNNRRGGNQTGPGKGTNGNGVEACSETSQPEPEFEGEDEDEIIIVEDEDDSQPLHEEEVAEQQTRTIAGESSQRPSEHLMEVDEPIMAIVGPLREFTGQTRMTKTDAFAAVLNHCKRNRLFDPEDHNYVITDSKLRILMNELRVKVKRLARALPKWIIDLNESSTLM
mmetsp:Transcript_43213/g.67687  ORF Transcript_43213/g.67687 Transcript_43213/m.67687 type:complete len:538 (-) Transcript_43213:963-2576(-)